MSVPGAQSSDAPEMAVPIGTAQPGGWSSAYRTFTSIWSAAGWTTRPIGIGLAVRVGMFVVADVGARLAFPWAFKGPLRSWQQWDAGHYISIAAHGYTYVPQHGSQVNFFPLYPIGIWLVQPIMRLLDPRNAYLLAGIVISWLAFLFACATLYRLVARRFDRLTAHYAVLLLAIFPFGFYYGSAFSEALYVALALWAFLAVDRHRWWEAGIAALLAGAVRPPGLLVGACVVLAYGLDWLRTRHKLRASVLALSLTPLGTIAYALYCWVRFGDPRAYLHASEWGWHGGELQTGGLQTAWNLLSHPDNWLWSTHYITLLFSLYVLLALGFLLAVVPVLRLLGIPYAVFTTASIVMPVLTFPSVNSLGRYLSVVFPVFVVLAYGLRHHVALRDAVIILSAGLAGVFAVLFVAGFGLA